MGEYKTVSDHHAEAVRRLQRVWKFRDDAGRAAAVRDLAEALVDVRALFQRGDGLPDLGGRSAAYREFVHGVYEDSGVPREEWARLQSAVRYHVTAVVRERFSAETLAEYGMGPDDARQKSVTRRANRTAQLRALTSKDLHGGSLVAIVALEAVINGINADELAAMDDAAKATADASLAGVERRIGGLRERLRQGE